MTRSRSAARVGSWRRATAPGASATILRFSTSMKSLNLLQKFVHEERLDQDRNILPCNRLDRFRPDVTSHDNGGNIPAKSGTQGLYALNTVGRTTQVIVR